MKRKFFMLLTLALTVLFIGQAYADSATIHNLGEGNYTTAGDTIINITGSNGQTIINAVDIIPSGGTIMLNGNFKLPDQINIKKPLTIRSINGSTLDGQNKYRVLRCQGQGIVLENLNIINGGFTLEGGGINIDNCSIDIINCKIANNSAILYGSGINVKNTCSIRMVSCDISDNGTSSDVKFSIGGGICANWLGTSTIEMLNCRITGNSASIGGGLYIGDTDVTVRGTNCEISGNTPEDFKGKITLDGVVHSAEHSDDSESSSSGGGCDAAGLGLMSLALAFILRRKR